MVMHLVDEINQKSFYLISLLEVTNRKSELEEFENYKRWVDTLGLVPVPELMHLPKISGLVRYNNDLYGNKINMYAEVEGFKVGLSGANYKFLIELANIIIADKRISSFVDVDYVEDCIFKWLIDYYKEKRVKVNILDYIQFSIDSDLKEYNFYYRATGIFIEVPFYVGDVEVTKFTSEYLEKELVKYLAIRESNTKEEFNMLFGDYKDRVIYKVSVKGVMKKAEKIARDKVILAINSLKMFFVNESLNFNYQLFNVDFSDDNKKGYYYIYDTKSDEFDFIAESGLLNSGAQPIILDKPLIETISSVGLDYLSEFLRSDCETELCAEIKIGINRIGEALSTRNLHERIVRIISFFEGLILPKTNPNGKGETTLKKQIIKKVTALDDKIKDYDKSIRECYEIRNKYLHNRIELHINLEYLHNLQLVAIAFAFDVIRLCRSIDTLEKLYSYYDIPT